MSDNMWGYQPTAGHTAGNTLTGYKVEASDGSIGKVDKHSDEVGSSYLVVDTGVWIFGKHVLLPASTVTRVDTAEETIYVDRTKAEIKDAPEFDKDKHLGDSDYHEQVGGHYGKHRRI
ncbi:PRC-barrel domain containing protein [Streptomyces sp. NBC_01317]|uniref:PRC-barrel domain containing protein n=1 Tax=Streptomyces sp. NBC_01317 TaxID=2903822 RepID=UPI002E11CCA2|nr:PRC-barrel domain containing protein [Streptomyces sp. NBC_01317]